MVGNGGCFCGPNKSAGFHCTEEQPQKYSSCFWHIEGHKIGDQRKCSHILSLFISFGGSLSSISIKCG